MEALIAIFNSKAYFLNVEKVDFALMLMFCLPGHNHRGVAVLSCGKTKSNFGSSMPDFDNSSSASFLSNSKRTLKSRRLLQLTFSKRNYEFQQKPVIAQLGRECCRGGSQKRLSHPGKSMICDQIGDPKKKATYYGRDNFIMAIITLIRVRLENPSLHSGQTHNGNILLFACELISGFDDQDV